MNRIKGITKQEYDSLNLWGMVVSLDLDGCSYKKITEPELMKVFVGELCKEIGMRQHGEPHVDKFAEGDLEGWSLMQFIETSSITIHNDDKKGKRRSFVDIFSCQYFDAQKAAAFCKSFLEAETVKMSILLRGAAPV